MKGCGESEEYLDELIEKARFVATWAANDANKLCNRLEMLEDHPRWKDRLEGEPRTLGRFYEEVLGWPADYIATIREGRTILDRAEKIAPTCGEAYAEGIRERTRRTALGLEGKTVNDHPGPLTDEQKSNAHIMSVRSQGHGTNAAYLAARLHRDFPEIAARLREGKYRSVRAAAKEVGLVRPQATIYVDDPDAAARALRKHFEGDRLAALIEALSRPRAP